MSKIEPKMDKMRPKWCKMKMGFALQRHCWIVATIGLIEAYERLSRLQAGPHARKPACRCTHVLAHRPAPAHRLMHMHLCTCASAQAYVHAPMHLHMRAGPLGPAPGPCGTCAPRARARNSTTCRITRVLGLLAPLSDRTWSPMYLAKQVTSGLLAILLPQFAPWRGNCSLLQCLPSQITLLDKTKRSIFTCAGAMSSLGAPKFARIQKHSFLGSFCRLHCR